MRALLEIGQMPQEHNALLAAKFVESRFAADLVQSQPLRIRCSLMLSRILNEIKFREVIDRWCSDDGDVASSIVLEAYIHCRYESQKPCPVSQFQEWYAKSSLPVTLGVPAEKMNEARLGRVLELVGNAPQEMWIELVVNANSAYDLDLGYLINDTTSFYFEGEYDDSVLVRYGYSRDGKPECKQINVSLTVTGIHGIPLQYRIIPGNTSDVATVIPNAESLCNLFKALGEPGRIVVVADKGLLTRPLIRFYEKAGVGFIGTMKCPMQEADAIRGVEDAELLASKLDYCAVRYKGNPKKEESESYYAVRRTMTLPEFEEEGTRHPSTSITTLVVLSRGKERLDRNKRLDLLEKQEARLNEIAGYLNKGRYCGEEFARKQAESAISKYPSVRGMISVWLQAGQDGLLTLSHKRDEKAISAAAQLDGKYIVYCSESHLSDNEIFRRFKSRDKVEKRIDTTKGTIIVRPIYLHKEARIRGLVFSTMTALLVFGITELLAMRDQKKITGEEIRRQLDGYEGSILTFSDGSSIVVYPEGNEWQKQLHMAVGVNTGHWITLRGPETSPEVSTPCPWIDLRQTE